MKRFHVHVHVDDLARSIGFYSKLFAAEPARRETDYAKWMLDDPPVNFAISTRGRQPGIDHLGIQTDDPAELAAIKARATAADMAMLDEGQDHLLLCAQREALDHRPAGHCLGAVPYAGQHPSVQRSRRAARKCVGLLCAGRCDCRDRARELAATGTRQSGEHGGQGIHNVLLLRRAERSTRQRGEVASERPRHRPCSSADMPVTALRILLVSDLQHTLAAWAGWLGPDPVRGGRPPGSARRPRRRAARAGYFSPFHHSTLVRGAPMVSTSPISGVASVRRCASASAATRSIGSCQVWKARLKVLLCTR